MPVSLQRPPAAKLSPDHPVDDSLQRGRAKTTWGATTRAVARSTSTGGEQQLQLEQHQDDQHSIDTKASSKAKDLSHVPCKFYRANSCTAGQACPFSHDLNAGTSKPVCQWYAKGNCKFGHKCALAHILPGQPMSFDRKNKRAAQAALREAQSVAVTNNGHDSSALSASISPSSTIDLELQSGIARSLKQSVVGMEHAGSAPDGDWTSPKSTAASVLATSPSYGQYPGDSVFGSSDGSDGGPLRPMSSPTKALASFGSRQNSGMSPDHLAFPSSPPSNSSGISAALSAPSGLAQTLSQQLGGVSNRSSVAAQVMLSEQARRMSSTSDSLSPPRPSNIPRSSFTGSEALLMGSSPPLTMSGVSNGLGTRASPSIFGTSPFSGSKGLFMPSSYDSNDEGFPRSPPSRSLGLPDMVRRSSSAGWTNGMSFADLNHDDGDEDDDDQAAGDAYDEGFLPSSLNDLLTPEEQRRRASKSAQTLHGFALSSSSKSSFNPFQPQEHQHSPSFASRSVPAEMILARGVAGKSSPVPVRGGVTTSTSTSSAWGTLSASAEGTNPTAASFSPSSFNSTGTGGGGGTGSTTRRSLLSAGISPTPPLAFSNHHAAPQLSSSSTSSSSLHPHHATQPHQYSASFDPRTALTSGSRSEVRARAVNDIHGDNGNSSLLDSSTTIPIGPGSLPGGLAAGLSQLHLIPPRHTGETPPTTTTELHHHHHHHHLGVSSTSPSTRDESGRVTTAAGLSSQSQSSSQPPAIKSFAAAVTGSGTGVGPGSSSTAVAVTAASTNDSATTTTTSRSSGRTMGAGLTTTMPTTTTIGGEPVSEAEDEGDGDGEDIQFSMDA